MAINLTTFETALQTKFDNTSDAKEMLLLTKALESTSTVNVSGIIETNSNAVTNFWVGTQAEYDALTPQANVLYFISG